MGKKLKRKIKFVFLRLCYPLPNQKLHISWNYAPLIIIIIIHNFAADDAPCYYCIILIFLLFQLLRNTICPRIIKFQKLEPEVPNKQLLLCVKDIFLLFLIQCFSFILTLHMILSSYITILLLLMQSKYGILILIINLINKLEPKTLQ